MYEVDRNTLEVLPAAPRYLKRNAARAMGGYIIRGVVELLTNARDSGYRLFEHDVVDEEDLAATPIVVEYYGQGCDPPRLVVRDRFEGMDKDDMEERLLQYGTPVSGFGRGSAVRGLNARGAKDVASLGSLRYESVKDDKLTSCTIVGGQYEPPTKIQASTQERDKIGLGEGNGTVVTLVPDREITFPQFDRLARDLNRHIEIRYQPEGMPRIPILLQEVKRGGVGRERDIAGFDPEGTEIATEEIPLTDYKSYGGPGKLTLYYSDEALDLGGRSVTRLWKSEAGVLVADGHTAHEIGFFGAEGRDDAAARHLYGTLVLPQIEELLLEFETIEKRKEDGTEVATPDKNPAQVTDPDRLGLNREHPFVQSVIESVRPILEHHLEELQDDITPSAQERIGGELRESLSRLGKKLAEQLEVEEGAEGGNGGRPWGLTFVPGGVRLEAQDQRTVSIYYRTDSDGEAEQFDCSLEDEGQGISLNESLVSLSRVDDEPGVYRGQLEVQAVKEDTVNYINATVNGTSASLRVSVREPSDKEVELDKDLQLSQAIYNSVPGRRKTVTCYSDPSLCGERIAISVTNDRLEVDKTGHFEARGPTPYERSTSLSRCWTNSSWSSSR